MLHDSKLLILAVVSKIAGMAIFILQVKLIQGS